MSTLTLVVPPKGPHMTAISQYQVMGIATNEVNDRLVA